MVVGTSVFSIQSAATMTWMEVLAWLPTWAVIASVFIMCFGVCFMTPVEPTSTTQLLVVIRVTTSSFSNTNDNIYLLLSLNFYSYQQTCKYIVRNIQSIVYCAVFMRQLFLLNLIILDLTLNQINYNKAHNKCQCNKELISYEKLTRS